MRLRFALGLASAFLCAGLSARADVIEYFALGEEGRKLETGSGSDGAFSDGPAQAGVAVAGANITIDTDVKSVFEFSSFALSGGHTIRATGSRPLVIRVSGDARVAGAIRLDGGAGGGANAAAPTATGGVPGAGGGRGGIGGESVPNTSAETGQPAPSSAFASGGGALPNELATNGQRAGGGACLGDDAGFPATAGGGNQPGASAGACALSSADVADRFESVFAEAVAGGAGGGGGGTYPLAGQNMNGAGGGGGGGALQLTARGSIDLTGGTLAATGGDGGAGALGAQDFAASGGGGSGGAIWIRCAGRLSGSGTLDVSGGQGGIDTSGANQSLGGAGGRGVIRLDAGANAFTGTFTPSGAADRAYAVYPATTEFVISGGPGCGVLRRDGQSKSERERRSAEDRDGFLALVAFFAAWRILSRSPARLSFRSPS